jgi:hypothetical protein
MWSIKLIWAGDPAKRPTHVECSGIFNGSPTTRVVMTTIDAEGKRVVEVFGGAVAAMLRNGWVRA